MACVNTCSCDRGYIRGAVYDEDTGKSVARDHTCAECSGNQCMDCIYGDGCWPMGK